MRLQRTVYLVRPLTALERLVAARWWRNRITMLEVLERRTQSRSGRCFAVVDGGRT